MWRCICQGSRRGPESMPARAAWVDCTTPGCLGLSVDLEGTGHAKLSCAGQDVTGREGPSSPRSRFSRSLCLREADACVLSGLSSSCCCGRSKRLTAVCSPRRWKMAARSGSHQDQANVSRIQTTATQIFVRAAWVGMQWAHHVGGGTFAACGTRARRRVLQAHVAFWTLEQRRRMHRHTCAVTMAKCK